MKNSFHEQSDIAREEDRLTDALNLIERVIAEYQKADDLEGVVSALLSRCLIHKHQFLVSNELKFAELAQNDAEECLQIAQSKKLTHGMGACYFRLGEIAMLFGNFEGAVNKYQSSIKHYEGTRCEKGDYQYHLGEALYRVGKKGQGKRVMLEGLREIQNNRNDVDSFLVNVWESGCYIRLAQLLKHDKSRQAASYLEKARAIIEPDPRLVIRKRQLELLVKDFNIR